MKRYHLHRESANLRIDYKKELNAEQYAVVMHQNGPVLVLAGAGTGKTRTVTYRVARLIETNISPENILLLTFTNKAAKEMMRRAEFLIGRDIQGLRGGTFHHIGNMILRRHCLLLGYRQGFSILDREDAKELFDMCIPERRTRETIIPKGSVLCEMHSLMKNSETSIEEIVHHRFPHFTNVTDEIQRIMALYESKKIALNLMDFDDLLSNWKKLLVEHDEIKEYYGSKFRYILVDEYQDTNRLQADIVDLLADSSRNLMVVGDDAQSIYSFRGADFANIIQFPERYPDVTTYTLTVNYRSTPEILSLANSSITNNIRQFQKELHSIKSPGSIPYIVPLKDVFQQADFVAQRILEMHAEGQPLNGIAVLYRSHYQSMELQMELQRRGIPFEMRSGLKFFELAHIKDVMAFLRVLVNSYDELSWKRVMKLIPGIGNVTAAKLWDVMSRSELPFDTVFGLERLVPRKALDAFRLFLHLLKTLKEGEQGLGILTPSTTIEHILGNGYEDYLFSRYPDAQERAEDIRQMSRFATHYVSLELFISELSLQSVASGEIGEESTDGECVILSTVHQAKGLEWNAVFLIGLIDGRFPSARSLSTDNEEEERRLFYVAVTRAKEELSLCYPFASEDWYSLGFLRPSRFLRELPRDVYEEVIVEEKNEIY
jgi:DNA helicase II / ATP-dependent DNA helicase PcrA